MKTLSTILAAALVAATAGTAFAGDGGCAWGAKATTAQTTSQAPITTASVPSTIKSQ